MSQQTTASSRTTRPIRSSPLAGLAFSNNLPINITSTHHDDRSLLPPPSTSIPTITLNNDDILPRPSFAHSRSLSFPYSLDKSKSSSSSLEPVTSHTSKSPSVSRNPHDNWMTSSPLSPATTPRFSRLSLSSKPVVMPLSAREYCKQKRTSIITQTNPTYPPSITERFTKERVNHLPHVILPDYHSSRHLTQSGSASSISTHSHSIPSNKTSLSQQTSISPDPPLSAKASIGTFFSFTSDNEADSPVITVIDPTVTPSQTISYPKPSRPHSRLSLVDAVNRLSQASIDTADTVYCDMDDTRSLRQIQISVTEDDGLLRRACSTRKIHQSPSPKALSADTAAEPTTPQERVRVVRIAEPSKVSSLRSPHSLVPETSVKQKASCPSSSSEAHARPRRKLTKFRTQSIQGSPARQQSSLLSIDNPNQSPSTTSIPDAALPENHLFQIHESAGSAEHNKRLTRRLASRFIPFPLTFSSSLSSLSTSSLSGSSTTMISRETSVTSIIPPTLATTHRIEQPYLKVPSNLKEYIVAQSGSDTDNQEVNSIRDESTTLVNPRHCTALHDDDLQEKSSSFYTVSSYASFTSLSTAGSEMAALDVKNAQCSLCGHPELGSHASVIKHQAQAPDHPMWTVPMFTINPTSQNAPLPCTDDISTTSHQPTVRSTFIPVPDPAPALKNLSTARLKRPRPQTAPNFATPPANTNTPKGKKVGFKFMFRSLLGRLG